MGAPLPSGATTDEYTEPTWNQGTRDGRAPPEQICESLVRSRRWGRSFSQAWPIALENTKWPKEMEPRHAWQRLYATPSHVENWRRAYERLPLPVDLSALHAAVEASAECRVEYL